MRSLSKVTEYPSVEQCIGGVADFTDTQPWIYALDNPYLHGVYAPTSAQLDVSGLQVEGQLPADLEGAYFRNGPNPLFEPKNRYHPFDGDGMVHGVYFRDGQVAYRNRYVNTIALQGEEATGRSVSPGVMGPFDYSLSQFGIKDTSNTDIFLFNGDLMSRLKTKSQSGIVDQYINFAKIRRQRRDRSFNRLVIADIKLYDMNSSGASQFVTQGFQSLFASCRQDESRTFSRKSTCAGFAETGRCAGDENGFYRHN
jgi:hypothetical protein